MGEIELMSTTTLPGLNPAAMPASPNNTASTSGVSGTIVMTMSARSAAARALVHGVALLLAIASGTFPRVWTNSECPALINWPAIGAPMMPRPTKPILRACEVMNFPWSLQVGSQALRYFTSRSRQPRPASVVAAGLYSQPIQPL